MYVRVMELILLLELLAKRENGPSVVVVFVELSNEENWNFGGRSISFEGVLDND